MKKAKILMKKARLNKKERLVVNKYVREYIKLENAFCKITINIEKELTNALNSKYIYEFVRCDGGWFLVRYIKDKFHSTIRLVIHDFEAPDVS